MMALLYTPPSSFTELVMRAVVGFFFAVSGYHKLFNRERHSTLRATLSDLGIPAVKFNEWLVPVVELTAGGATMVGLAFPLSPIALLGICTVATCTDGVRRIKAYHPVDRADWLDDLLYLPEMLYALILVTLIVQWFKVL